MIAIASSDTGSKYGMECGMGCWAYLSQLNIRAKHEMKGKRTRACIALPRTPVLVSAESYLVLRGKEMLVLDDISTQVRNKMMDVDLCIVCSMVDMVSHGL